MTKPKLFIAILFIVILTNACKKHSVPPAVTSSAAMKFTLNGSDVSLVNCLGLFAYDGSNFVAYFIGNNANPGLVGPNTFEIRLVQDGNPLKAGQVFPVANAAKQVNTSVLLYTKDGQAGFYTQYANALGSVTITNVTDTSVSGTFSGKLFAAADSAGTKVIYTVTNGSFTSKI